MTSYIPKTVTVDGIDMFYREAGSPTAPTLLLLHGFPSSSHQFRNLIPLLSHKYHIIAPDLPGYGFTQVPSSRNYTYTFAQLALTIEALLDVLHIDKFSIYIFDYGAPVGLRIALHRPKSIQAIFSQNGNAYDVGLGAGFWDTLHPLWETNSLPARQEVASRLLSLETTKWQYENGARAPVAPEAPYLDFALMQRHGNDEVQLDLFYDYQNNVKLYPDFHKFFRESQVPLIAFWGKNDEIFVPPGAEAFKTDLPKAEIHLLDAGHFAIETNTVDIAGLMLGFLEKNAI